MWPVRWLALVAVMVGVGALQVAQRTAVVLKGYAVGRQERELHEEAVRVSWLHAEVTGLSSPTSLRETAQERHPELVAQSTLAQAPSRATPEIRITATGQVGVGDE